MSTTGPRIVMIAGEASGDALGAGLAHSLKKARPNIELAGIAGPAMQSAGVEAWHDLDELSIMGLTEIIRHLPRLFALRRKLKKRILDWQPDVFVGIDAPEFNLGLSRQLRRRGQRTAHYVAPTVWAWRPGRTVTVARSTDLLLTLFPFEPALFRAHGLPSRFVGHVLADDIAASPQLLAKRTQATRHADEPTPPHVVLLPGSRNGEIERHARLLADTALWLRNRQPAMTIRILLAHDSQKKLLNSMAGEQLARAGARIVCGRTRSEMAAADVAISASGTATLEAFLLECPLVVYYRLTPASYFLLRTFRLIQSPFIALPNILQGRSVAPEFVQQAAQPQALGQAALDWIDNAGRRQVYQQVAARCREELAAGASDNAASALLELIDKE